MEKLKQRGSQFAIVLNDTGANTLVSAHEIVRKLCCNDDVTIVYCACIKHDNDIDDESGNLKTIHYHLVVQIGSNCCLGTFIKFLCDLLHVNENQVTIEKCTSLVMQTRYLIHLDDFDKHQYKQEDISTNNIDFVKKAMTYIKGISCIDDLIAICREYKNNLLTLMSVIGYDNYKKYRVVISDIRREILGLPIK